MRTSMLSRRRFIKGLLCCAATVCCSSLGCTPGKPSTEVQRKAARARVWAWLRMFPTEGMTAVPTSEADYVANLAKIDVAMPLNGGKLQADGTWLQESWKTEAEWPQSLPQLARAAGHLYMPGVGNDREGTISVLNNTALQARAADNLVELASSGRFDSRWDGIFLNLEGIPLAYRQELKEFLEVLARRIKQADFLLGISVGGRAGDYGPSYEDAYTYDLSTVGRVADYVDLRCYGYWKPLPRSISPYWWIQASVDYALSKGIAPHRLVLGLGNFSKYWPDPSSPEASEITYEQALRLVSEAGSTIEWIEANEHGLVRERYASLGDGQLWIHDEDTHRFGLDLADQCGLQGTTLFAPGMGAPALWEVIADWR